MVSLSNHEVVPQETIMSKVMAFKSMSLDGFIAGPHDEIEPLHDWLFTTKPYAPGNYEKAGGDTEKFFGPEGANKDLLFGLMDIDGATIVGRHTYDVARGWGGKPPGKGSYFVMTHTPPPTDDVSKAFTFVTDGLESALRQARAASKSGVVELMGGKIIQQGLAAGVVDELIVILIPVILGKGIRLFDNLGDSGPITLSRTKVTEGPSGVTHLHFDVVR
jgi:dihydrofolate reductase